MLETQRRRNDSRSPPLKHTPVEREILQLLPSCSSSSENYYFLLLLLLPSPTLFGYETFPIVGAADEENKKKKRKKGISLKRCHICVTAAPYIYGGYKSERKRNYDGPPYIPPVGRRPIFDLMVPQLSVSSTRPTLLHTLAVCSENVAEPPPCYIIKRHKESPTVSCRFFFFAPIIQKGE